MNRLVQELRDLNLKARLLCFALITLAVGILIESFNHILHTSARDQALLFGLAVVVAVWTGSHPIRLPGTTKTMVSVSESVIFLAAIILGPYQAFLLGTLDGFEARKLAKLRIYVAINASILALSAFASARMYQIVQSYLQSNTILGGEQRSLELLVFPLTVLALTHYAVNISLTAIFSKAVGTAGFISTLKETFPWIPVTYLAGATAAGMTGYALSKYSLEAALLVLVLALPMPLIIYYTFKTYHAKLEEERRHLDQVNELHRSTLEALAMAIDAKDQTTHKHIRRVQIYARRLGELMGMGGKQLQALEAASLLHDIGKLGVPDYILNKPGKLTPYEFEKMKTHTVIGGEILSNVKFDFPVAAYVRAHHERWDGAGYPDGLRGEQIPLGARILALVDHFDALHSDRPYRRALTRAEVISRIEKLSGSFFDPSLVRIFLESLKSLDAEIEQAAVMEPDSSSPSSALAGNNSVPAAGYAEEQRPLSEVALSRIAAAHQEVATLHDIARVLSSTLSLQDAFAIITSRIANLVPYSTCVIYLLDAGKTRIRAKYASGLCMEMFREREIGVGEGVTGWVIANHRPLYNTSPMLDLTFLGVETAERFKGVAVFPVIKDGESLGAVALYSVDTPQYTDEHLRLLEMIMQPVSDALHNAVLFENTQQTALTDALTGLPNMRAFALHFEREISSANRSNHPLSILLIDLNDFKRVNDTFGHVVGDRVLQDFAQLLRHQLRDCDVVARYAGDEFVTLMPMTDQQQALYVINRLQAAINRPFLTISEDEQISVTASIGAATAPADGQSFEELMMNADKQMYRSKDNVKSRGQVTKLPHRIARIS